MAELELRNRQTMIDYISVARNSVEKLAVELDAGTLKESDLEFVLESQEPGSIYEGSTKTNLEIGATIATLILQAANLGLQYYQVELGKQTNHKPQIEIIIDKQVIIDTIQANPNFSLAEYDSVPAEVQSRALELVAEEIINQAT